jgi:hypothetical protein
MTDQTRHTPAEAVQYWYDAATERREERDRLRAVVARVRQMADYWEQQLPEVIRTPAVVSALRAALEPAVSSVGQAPTPNRTALRDRIRRAVCEAEGFAWDSDMLEPDEYGEVADAVLAVLPEPTDRAAVCICGHTEQQHFEDVCITEITGCDCGDFLPPDAAREVIARWREAATRKPADQTAVATAGPVKQRADLTETEWAEQERARFERLYTRETVRADLAEQRADTAARDADIYQKRLERLSEGYTEQRKRAEAMERAMESTAADALAHRGCHRDLMAQCLRAERAEAEVGRLRIDRTALLREAADAVLEENGRCPAVGPCQPCETRERSAAELRRLAAEPAAVVSGRAADETQDEAPRRGDPFEAWLKAQRDERRDDDRGQWGTLDNLLDLYRLHADTGTPLGEHVCEARTVPPAHTGGGANAEDCPACSGTNPPYPFLCAGPDAPAVGGAQQPTEARTVLRCNWARTLHEHTPHDWEPQPGMDPVHCPGFAKQQPTGARP